ncbi:MAG: hypothetical protein KC931_18280, partial [Candidatus Omnitrophica bacterium]|nr:hypothetical protein [Candidatus Omnitrophota bacterium]
GFFFFFFGVIKPEAGSILLAAELYSRGHLILMALCAALAFQPLQAFDWAPTITWKKMVILILLFVVAIMMMFVQAFNPFLYFQF